MSVDHYRTLEQRVEFRHKIERSEFLGIAEPVTNEDAFASFLRETEKRYFDATHHCWAFRLFANGETRARSSDAGEPSGTAGKPILLAIEGAGLYDATVIVVRWFGGIKLGTGGLARAYRDTAANTLERAALLDRYVYQRIRVIVPFPSLSTVYRMVSVPDVNLTAERFGNESNEFEFDVRLTRVGEFTNALTEKRLAFTLL